MQCKKKDCPNQILDSLFLWRWEGHASPKMLKKYIKADSLEVVEKLTDKYEYFR